jgi:hypothetical protein
MSDDRQDGTPDYSELLRSPYEPDPDRGPREGESDLPWVPAVVAACVGALIVGAFVVFAVVTGPDGDDEVASSPTSSSTTTTVAAQPAEGPPDGFVAVTDDVSAAVLTSATASSIGTIVTVATAVDAGDDPAQVAPPDIAYWTLLSGGAEIPMVGQFTSKAGVGNVTVQFPPQLSLRDPMVVPHVAVGTPVEEVVSLELDPTLDQSVAPFQVEVGGQTVTIEELSFGASWGWVQWSADDWVAQVDATITFVGTDDPGQDGENPTQLLPLSRRPFAFGLPERPLPTPYGFSGSEALVRVGEPIVGDNVPTSILVEVRITVPEDIVEAAPIEVPPLG